jgi:predicted unusual protein kinase regulating ubiquinone biosynthesis (AarF/ABC1/UbiB family)
VVESFGGRQLDEVFSEFDREPVASGSVAQVHRARFRDDAQEAGEFAGKEVAVKVLHPLVMESTFVDISLIFGLLNTAGRLLNMGMPFDQASFYHAMSRQLDLNWEAYNLRQFRENFGDDTGILFPLVAHSTDRVLVESWFDGKSISHIFATGGGESAWGHSEKRVGGEDDQMSEERRRRIAKKVFDLTIKMFLRDNYIHGGSLLQNHHQISRE